jgi:hypothetical protein
MFFRSAGKPEESAVAVAEPDEPRTEAPPPPSGDEAPTHAPKSRDKKKDDDELEYEWEFETPFGKIEFEVEPKERKEEKDRKKKEKAERDAQKQAAKLAKKAERASRKSAVAEAGEIVVVKRSNLVPALVIFAIIVASIAIAFWLFARPGEEEDQIPEEYRAATPEGAEAEQQGGLAARLKKAIRAGRQASREAQREQQQRFEEATHRDQ